MRRLLPSTHVVGVVASWICSAVAIAGVCVHYSRVEWQPAIIIASFAPFLMVFAVPALVLFGLRRRIDGTALALVVLLVAAWTQLPLFRGERGAPGSANLTVMQANLLFGQADARRLVEQVRANRVDVLTTDELTPKAVERLHDAGLDDVLPYRFVAPEDGAQGTGIWSRQALSAQVRHPGYVFANLSARTTTADGRAVVVTAVHTRPPWPDPERRRDWVAEMRSLGTLIQRQAGESTPVVVSGDFNATWDHAPYRALLDDDLRDTAERAGAGFLPTYPADRRYHPVLALDHVLSSRSGTVDARSITLAGSDHRGLLVRLAVQNS